MSELIEKPNDSGGMRAPWLCVLLLMGMSLAAFAPAIVRGGFIWDDDLYLKDNPLVTRAEGIGAIWGAPSDSPQYYPLVFTTFWMEYRLWGGNAMGYHVVNVVLHGVCAVLVWRVLRRMRAVGALLAATLFAVHPVMVESVAWISERKNVLSGVMYLGALLAYLRFKDEPGRVWKWYGLTLILFVLALLSKSVACSLPVAILLVQWYRTGRVGMRTVMETAPLFVMGLGAGLYTAYLERTHVGAVGAEWDFSILQRVLIASRAVCFYPWKLVVPVNLTFIYPRWAVDTGVWWQYVFVAGAGALIVVPLMLVKRVGRGLAAGVLFYVAAIFPALGFFNIFPMRFTFVADHYDYIAAIGLLAIIAGGMTRVSRGWPAWMRTGTAASVLIVLMVMSGLQCLIYQSPTVLWTDTLNKNPDAWIAQSNLGIIELQEGNLDSAVRRIERAYQLDPHAQEVYVDLGNAYYLAGRLDDAQRIFDAGLNIEGDGYTSAVMANTVGAIQLKKGNAAIAAGYFKRAIGLRPKMSMPYANLARAELAMGQVESARRDANRALQLDGTNAWAKIVLERLQQATETRP